MSEKKTLGRGASNIQFLFDTKPWKTVVEIKKQMK